MTTPTNEQKEKLVTVIEDAVHLNNSMGLGSLQLIAAICEVYIGDSRKNEAAIRASEVVGTLETLRVEFLTRILDAKRRMEHTPEKDEGEKK